MWAEFWLAVLVGTVFVFVPSYVLLRVFGFRRISSAACAPIVSLLFYSLLAIVYDKMAIWTDGWRLFLPLCALAVVAVVVKAVVLRRRQGAAGVKGDGAPLASRLWGQDSWLILLYALVSIVVASYIFLDALPNADTTSYNYDDQSHLAYLRSFLERGDYSSLAVSANYDLGGSDAYYPAAWHLFAASIISICGVTNYVGANAVLFIMCALIYPMGCLFAVRKIFKDRLGIQITGAFLTLVFASFPWEFVHYGRLVANLLAFCFVPVMLACTIVIFEKGNGRSMRVRAAVILMASFCMSLFTQPSVCFTWLYFAVPYLMHVIWNAGSKDGQSVSVKKKVLRVGLFCLVVFVFLIGCYMLPPLWNLTRFKWLAPMSVPDAILNVLLQGLTGGPYSLVVAVFVIVGLVLAVRKSETRWLVLLWFILGAIYVIDAGTNLRLKNYTTGWWYTDSHRVMAMFGIASYYLAVLGVGSPLWKLVSRLASQPMRIGCQMAGSLLASLLALCTVVVGGVSLTSVGYVKGTISGIYSVSTTDENALISQPEREFIKKAAEITGDDIVFNIPKDGSAFAYQISGMKVLTRWSDEGLSPNVSIRLMQRSLDDIATNASVRRAVDDLGIEYVMMLDQGHVPFTDWWEPYSDSNWTGVLNISEDTPGFELMLSDGDMKLYRILSEEETAEQMAQRDS